MPSEHRIPPSLIPCAIVNMPKRLVLTKSEDQSQMRTNSNYFMHEMRTKRAVHTHNNNNNNNNIPTNMRKPVD